MEFIFASMDSRNEQTLVDVRVGEGECNQIGDEVMIPLTDHNVISCAVEGIERFGKPKDKIDATHPGEIVLSDIEPHRIKTVNVPYDDDGIVDAVTAGAN